MKRLIILSFFCLISFSTIVYAEEETVNQTQEVCNIAATLEKDPPLAPWIKMLRDSGLLTAMGGDLPKEATLFVPIASESLSKDLDKITDNDAALLTLYHIIAAGQFDSQDLLEEEAIITALPNVLLHFQQGELNSVLVKSPANEATARIMMTMELCGSTVHVLTHALHPQESDHADGVEGMRSTLEALPPSPAPLEY